MGNSILPLGGGDTRRINETVIQAAHGFSAGEVVRHNGTQFVLAQADSAANAEAVGIIESATVNDFEVVFQGRIDISGLGYGANEVRFLDATVAGGLSLTPPTTAGSVIKAMLITGDANDGFVTGYVGVQIGGDNTVLLGEIQPIGAIMPWAADAGSPVPVGWALCDGQAISRTTYSDLFNLIGTIYGIGDGATTFNVPDLRRCVPVGEDPGAPALDPFLDVGNTGGAIDHTLIVDELPDHTHDHDNLPVFDPGGGAPYTALVVPPGPPPVPVGPLTAAPGPVGQPHNNLQPYLVINFIIRTTEQASAALLDHYLDDHADVDVPAPADQEVLTWNAGTSMWESAPAGSNFAFRNVFINGQFDVWQRGSSWAWPALTTNQYTADRWEMAFDKGTTGTITAAAARVMFAPGQTDVPGQPTYHIDFSGSVAGGLGDETALLNQRIEDVRTLNGETATLSFWAKGSIAGAITVFPKQFFGGGGSSSVIFDETVVNLTTSWQKFTLQFNVPSILGKTIGTNSSLRFRFFTHAGPTAPLPLTAPFAYGGTVSLANVQLEQGAVATPFEKRPLETEWGLCQRYYQQSYDEGVTAGSFPYFAGPEVWEASGGSSGEKTVPFPTRMRIPPSVIFYDWDTGAPFLATEHTPGPLPSPSGLGIFPVAPNLPSERGFDYHYPNTNPATSGIFAMHWTADAEL